MKSMSLRIACGLLGIVGVCGCTGLANRSPDSLALDPANDHATIDGVEIRLGPAKIGFCNFMPQLRPMRGLREDYREDRVDHGWLPIETSSPEGVPAGLRVRAICFLHEGHIYCAKSISSSNSIRVETSSDSTRRCSEDAGHIVCDVSSSRGTLHSKDFRAKFKGPLCDYRHRYIDLFVEVVTNGSKRVLLQRKGMVIDHAL